jgi:hypothetical protein
LVMCPTYAGSVQEDDNTQNEALSREIAFVEPFKPRAKRPEVAAARRVLDKTHELARWVALTP